MSVLRAKYARLGRQLRRAQKFKRTRRARINAAWAANQAAVNDATALRHLRVAEAAERENFECGERVRDIQAVMLTLQGATTDD